MNSLRVLHEYTPFVRLTPEETQLLREQLSNPQGGLPAYHKTTPHSEKVRHILLKSFLRFAPDVPVLSHHYKRPERFGVDDSFMKIDWEWMETSASELASSDPIDSAHW
ncbi:uncharacterized protein STEHIDRAFT_153144 [Stereum hirsutum FP-91666 SS1]|uniref:uncharacterized protein n=1 Tax=Stereum hirsutum (strain FP-91666) TaxID=721885 RepID=UPI000440AE38|nr:uncharacterized protein STEHIDRAFT_153144 [Stereum hirsutum FP-91666 SS1]EIM91506.1 hypothetical protein STEHIDRAFT_153144 [Stereum hirsutum FP-91666 SS1]